MPAQTNQTQGRYWMLTIPAHAFTAHLPKSCQYIKGQIEEGEADGYRHWQLMVITKRKVRLGGIRDVFGPYHAELTRSSAASEYVWKDETAVEGTRFELGEVPFHRNSAEDWKLVKAAAKRGALDDVPDEIYIKHYRTLKEIAKDNMVQPDALDDVCGVWIWGPPGVGKSHKARQDYDNVYDKMANKWWCGYSQQENILIDDLDKCHKVLGHHIKRWADKYPFIAETKGYAINIRPKKIIVTSNYRIEDIFEDEALIQAIKRRFNVIHVPLPLH